MTVTEWEKKKKERTEINLNENGYIYGKWTLPLCRVSPLTQVHQRVQMPQGVFILEINDIIIGQKQHHSVLHKAASSWFTRWKLERKAHSCMKAPEKTELKRYDCRFSSCRDDSVSDHPLQTKVWERRHLLMCPESSIILIPYTQLIPHISEYSFTYFFFLSLSKSSNFLWMFLLVHSLPYLLILLLTNLQKRC